MTLKRCWGAPIWTSAPATTPWPRREHAGIATAIRAEFTLTCKLIADIKGSTELLDADRTLQRSIALRNPYVDPMNLMQIDLLRRWRAGGRADPELFEALLASVSGIGAGLQTTG